MATLRLYVSFWMWELICINQVSSILIPIKCSYCTSIYSILYKPFTMINKTWYLHWPVRSDEVLNKGSNAIFSNLNGKKGANIWRSFSSIWSIQIANYSMQKPPPWYTYNRLCLHFRSFSLLCETTYVKERHIISNDEGCETDYMRKLSNNKTCRQNKRNHQNYQNPCLQVSDA